MRRSLSVRVLSLFLFLLGQGTMAFAAEHDQGADRLVTTIVICTPTGLEVIEWDLGGDDPPIRTLGPLCPLCISVADATQPQLTTARMADEGYERYAPPHRHCHRMFGDASPYPSRAPPA